MSFRLGAFAGIPVRIHWLFLVLVALVLLQNGMAAGSAAALGSLTLLGILFGSVVLHEFGHAIVARRFGARIVDITLWPLGGLTRMTHMPERPLPEFSVALAGPAVNAALLALAALLGAHVAVPGAGPRVGTSAPLDVFASVNLALALFNLAPAFPMDGGRALRAALSARFGFLRATELAVRIGRWCAVLSVLAAWFYSDLFWPTLLVAVFLWFQGAQELADARARYGIDPLREALLRTMGIDPRASAPPGATREGPRPEDSGTEIRRELESFRGNMEEYFRERDRRDR